jgi:drug/metabolite transporter (DMT)-like permease
LAGDYTCVIVTTQLRADAALLAVAVIWGATFVMVKAAVTHVGPLTFIGLRFTLAAVAMGALFHGRLRRVDRHAVGAGVLIGLFLLGGYSFQTAGLQFTTASKAGFITGLSVVAVPFAAWLWLGRPPGWRALVGVVLATVGLGLLTLQVGDRLAVATGDLLVLAGAISFALHITAIGAFAPRMDPLALATIQIATTGIVGSAAAFLFEAPQWPVIGSVWFAAGFTGILATCVAYSLQTLAQVFTTPTHTALIFATEPVFAAVFGVLLADEQLAARAWLGCLLILIGMLVAELRSPRGRRHVPATSPG